MSLRFVGTGLLVAAALFTAGCECCHKRTAVASAPPCCPAPAAPCCPSGGPIAPPIGVSGYAPPVVAIPAH